MAVQPLVARRHDRGGGVVRHRLLHPPGAHRHGHRRQGRDPHGGAQALQRAGKPLHLEGPADAGPADHRDTCPQRLCLRPTRRPVSHRRHARPRRHAGRRRAGSRPRPRAHPHPQPRHPADGDRHHLRRHLRLLRRHDHPRLGLPLRLVAHAAAPALAVGDAGTPRSRPAAGPPAATTAATDRVAADAAAVAEVPPSWRSRLPSASS